MKHDDSDASRSEEFQQIASAVEADDQLLIGGHVSAAGGVHRAIERGEQNAFNAIQVFTRNPNQWASPALKDEVVQEYRSLLESSGIRYVVAHDAYLINLATPDAALRKRSIEAVLDELDRAEILGIPDVVTHLGAHMGEGDDAGIERLISCLDTIVEARPDMKVRLALETTAGQGSTIGYRFEHIAEVIEGVQAPDRVAVCFDTCHAWVAGYDLKSEAGFDEVWRQFADIIGIDRLCCLHLNDAKREQGSRIDRHEHIGEGTLGDDPFRRIMQSEALAAVPKIVETPKAEAYHRVNVARLVELKHSV